MHAKPFRHIFPLLAASAALLLAGCGENVTVGGQDAAFDFAAPRQNWTHLDAETRALVDHGLAARPKPVLTILHSTGSPQASAAALADNHARVRRIPGGMAYHFVIGNGQGMPDGGIFVGPRWRDGGGSAALNDAEQESGAIAIALVGDFNRKEPSHAQLAALDELLDYLTGKIGPHPVRLHREVENSARACPGRKFPVEALRRAYKL